MKPRPLFLALRASLWTVSGIFLVGLGAGAPMWAGDPAPSPAPAPSQPAQAPAPAAGKGIEPRAQMRRSLDLALFLYEMDTAAWAASDQASPVLGRMDFKPGDDGGYVQWKDGNDWHVLFYYQKKAQEVRPWVEIVLASPVARGSRGTLTEFPKDAPPLAGEPLRLVRASMAVTQKFVDAVGHRPKPAFNVYVWKDPSGAFRGFLIPSDMEAGTTRLGPDWWMELDATGEKVVSDRQFHRASQVVRMGAASGQSSEVEKPVLALSTDLPEVTDFLFLLLHPELSPITAVTRTGRFRMKPGVLPAALPHMIAVGPPEPEGEGAQEPASKNGGKP